MGDFIQLLFYRPINLFFSVAVDGHPKRRDAIEVSPAFSCYFPKVEAERMANIIRDAVRAKSCSFMGPVPFKITVQRADETASASGEMREYVPGEFDEVPEELAVSVTHGNQKL